MLPDYKQLVSPTLRFINVCRPCMQTFQFEKFIEKII